MNRIYFGKNKYIDYEIPGWEYTFIFVIFFIVFVLGVVVNLLK